MRSYISIFLVLFFIAGLIGCAAWDAKIPEIDEAKSVLNEAWIKGASVKASYEYGSAETLLKNAIKERDEGDYVAARKFAVQALEKGKKALDLSK